LAEKALCTDNAAMIGVLAEQKLKLRANRTSLDSDIMPNWQLA
jgi:tRNA A37 threonylcarbamoyltransferase TsaD